MRISKILSVLLVLSVGLSGCAGQSGAGSSGNAPDGEGAETAVSQEAADQEAGQDEGQEAEGQEAGQDEDQEAEPGEYTKALAQRSQSSENSDPTITPVVPEGEGGSGSDGAAGKKACTVMIYMVGSNLESRLGNATKDIEEIDGAGLSFEDYNVIVYTGGSTRWVGDVPCDRNCVLDLSREGEERIVAQTKGNANMGLPETLSAFLNYCDENYPADHNMLILWDHGGGPLWGYGVDELYDSDSLLLDEMRTAMEGSAFSGGAKGKKLDLVGFDACLMASLECMTIWQDYADFYVGSEELEPGDGWNYEFLKVLDESGDWKEAGSDGFAKTVGDSILTSFEAYYGERKSENYNPDLTLSYVDLGRIEGLNGALDALAEKMADGVEGGEYANLMRDRSDIKSFGMSKDSQGDVSFYYDLVDVGNLADHMTAFYPEEAAAVSEALGAAVAGSYTNIEDAAGMTLYYPYKNKGQFEQLNEYYASFLKTQGYSRFLQVTEDQFFGSKSWDWNLGEPVDKGDEYTLQLTHEQMDNMTEATYSILSWGYGEAGYIPYMENCKIEPDKNGVLHVSKNVQLAVLRNGDELELIRAEQTGADRKRTDYSTKGIGLRSDLLYNSRITDLEYADVTIHMSKDKKSGETQIRNIELDDEASGISGGKSSVDLMDWEGLAVYAGKDYYAPARDGEGRIRPYKEWTKLNNIVWKTVAVSSEIGLEIVNLDECDLTEELIMQIEIRDINGEKYAAEPVSVTKEQKRQLAAAGDGQMEFILYEDHAVLESYNGRETRVEVPDQVDGIPVTEIGWSAFSRLSLFDSLGYDPVVEVVLPDTVTTIRSSAFAYCSDLQTVKLPAGLKEIGNEAFTDCSSLMEIELPDSVERIGKCAFANCSSLTEFRIPKGLVSLEEGAFMRCTALTKFTGGTQTSGVSSNGEGTGNFPVLDADGAVYTGDGEKLLAYPGAAGESFTVKEGTKEIGYGTFDGASLKEVILPEGLTKIGNYAFYNCDRLQAPAFPEGLAELGMHSFDTWDWAFEPEEVPAEQEVIYIPASLEKIGDHAFDKFVHARFEVSEDNRHYSAVDGALMNKAGDTVYYIATDPDFRGVYPEGTVEFTEDPLAVYGAVNNLTGGKVRQIYLPASMTKFPQALEDYQNSDRYAFYHCPAGSEAEKFALAMGVSFSNEMEIPKDKLEVPTEKGTLYFDLYSDHAVVSGYSGEDEAVEIPSEAGGKAVTAVGNGVEPLFSSDYALADTGRRAPNLTRIVIPEGVISINAEALSECNYGTEAVLPSTLKRLGKNSMSSLVVENLPEGLEILEENCINWPYDIPFVVRPEMSYIDDSFAGSVSAFEQEGENAAYSVRDGVLYNADGTVLLNFPSGSTAEEFSIPEGTISVGDNAFSDCIYLKKITLPASLKQIGSGSFSYCFALEEIGFEEGTEMESIGSYAFTSCDGFTEISLPPVEEIGESAFTLCENLGKVHLAEGTRVIGSSAFSSTAVAEPQFPESLVKIGDYAYWNMDEQLVPGSAEVIRIPAKVSEIGTLAFESIGNKEFEVDPENHSFSSAGCLLMDKYGNTVYQCALGASGTVVVPDGVTSIMFGAFSGAEGVTDVEIPDSVVFIASSNFDPVSVDDSNGGTKKVYPITIHCNKGSFAESYAVSRGIPCEAK